MTQNYMYPCSLPKSVSSSSIAAIHNIATSCQLLGITTNQQIDIYKNRQKVIHPILMHWPKNVTWPSTTWSHRLRLIISHPGEPGCSCTCSPGMSTSGPHGALCVCFCLCDVDVQGWLSSKWKLQDVRQHHTDRHGHAVILVCAHHFAV